MGKKSGPCPCDRGKGGVKRSPLTEATGIVVGLAVEGAHCHDMKLTRATLESVPPIIGAKRDAFFFGPVAVEGVDLEVELARVQAPDWEPDLETPCPASGLCLDAGFDYDEVREVAAEFGYTTHIVARGAEKQAKVAGQRARRWVVKRTHSWLNRYRRRLIRWEKKAQNYLALLHLACAPVVLRSARGSRSRSRWPARAPCRLPRSRRG